MAKPADPKASIVRLRSRDWFDREWWPLEVAVAWTASGDKKICRSIAFGVYKRRTRPHARLPTLGIALTIPEGFSRVKEATFGAAYRKSIRENPKALHPFDQAIKVTVDILAGKHSRAETSVKARPLARGSRGAGEESLWIPAGHWRAADVIEDRRAGLILQLSGEAVDAAWRRIDVLAAPFKAMGADRGRRALALSEVQRLGEGEKNRQRIKRKRALHDADMGRAPIKRGGRKKGSRNLVH